MSDTETHISGLVEKYKGKHCPRCIQRERLIAVVEESPTPPYNMVYLECPECRYLKEVEGFNQPLIAQNLARRLENMKYGGQTKSTKPQSEQVSPGIDQIPFEGLEAIGEIFAEGEKKYGRDNWKQDPGNEPYNRERTRHAIRHLMLWANGDRSENHLAKVAWFCVTTIWREKHNAS